MSLFHCLFKQRMAIQLQHLSNRLPFAEDERISDFPKLSQRRTTSGKLLPRDGEIQKEVDNLMSEFIDNLDSDEEESAPDRSPYYRQLRENAAETTISLPTRKDGLFEEYTDSDRLSIRGNYSTQDATAAI